MVVKLYSTVETEDAYEPDEEIGELILQDGEMELIMEDEELADELMDFFDEIRHENAGDPAGRVYITRSIEIEPGTEAHIKASIPKLLERFAILGRIEPD